jgi:hypothetical protein
MAALGLTAKDLFQGSANGSRPSANRANLLAPIQNGGPPSKYRFPIKDRDGNVTAYHLREGDGPGKKVWWELPDRTRGLGGRKTADLPLYKIENAVLEPPGSTIVVCEGEKAAQSLLRRGIPAVGTVTGASSCPSDASLADLRGYRVILWPDNDEPGAAHMVRVGDTLARLGLPDVRSVTWPRAPAHGDAADFPGSGDEVKRFLATAGALTVANGNASVPAFQLPDLFGRGLQVMTGREVMERRAAAVQNRMLIDGFLHLKEISLWSGKVEHGKTTMLRTLVMCVLRGEPFLGRPCVRSKVLYVMLDADGEDHTIDEFIKLGWDAEVDDLNFLFDPVFAMRPNALEDFHQKLIETRPALVVIDPMGRFQQIKDFNDYGSTYMMANLSELAKLAECHFALPHHIPRGRSDDADASTAGLGSIAIGGSVNARFVVTKKPGEIFTVKTSRGKGVGFVPLEGEQKVGPNPETGWIEVQGPYSWKDQARALKTAVLAAIEQSAEAMTSSKIAEQMGHSGLRSSVGAAANMLHADGQIQRIGAGRRHSPYEFAALSISLTNAPKGRSNSDIADISEGSPRGRDASEKSAKSRDAQKAFEYKKRLTPPGDDEEVDANGIPYYKD